MLVDVDKGLKNESTDKQYGNPTQVSLPVMVVLDPAESAHHQEHLSELEVGDHHDPAKVMAFLKEWPKR